MKETADKERSGVECVTFPRALIEQILEVACAASGVEICGLIAARDGQPLRCTPIRNVAPEPRQRFSMDPREQIAAFRQMRERGEELFAIYHSHPHAAAEPSATDISEAGYPDALQIIVSLQKATAPELHAWRFRNGHAVPVRLDIQPPAG